MYVFNRSLCLCVENGLTGGPSGIRGSAGRLVQWSRQERRGSETRVKQWRWRNMHGFRVMSGDSCNKCGGGDDGQPRSLSTWFKPVLTSTQVLLSGHLYISGAQPASRGRMVRRVGGSPNFAVNLEGD